MLIILLQEDSMSGGCVYHVRRDVLSEETFFILNVGLNLNSFILSSNISK